MTVGNGEENFDLQMEQVIHEIRNDAQAFGRRRGVAVTGEFASFESV
jgi:hypothetical protein